MKWILVFTFVAFKVLAETHLSELPADVQNEIKSTETTAVGSQTSTATEQVGIAAATTTTVVAEKISKSAKESEIPLSLESTKKTAQGETPYFRVIMIVALLGILACGTWVFVRRAKSQNIKRNKNEIKVLAQHYLGPKKSLAVVRVAGESILVGVTDVQINMIKTLSLLDDELPEVTTQNFQSELNVRMNHEAEEPISAKTYNRKSQLNKKETVSSEEDMDEFSIKGIKDLVSSKLKNMRSI
ncbi:MAG: flagellar biosynthetic protein FliO [Bdellovibrionaceae bacterium]|nr:flagellar biosynthetic protein FliO [Pseudobdellovibrionaceae bacterium]